MAELDDFFNPEIVRSRLVTASLCIAAFELLKRSIVDPIADFYMANPEYKKGFRSEEDYERHKKSYETEVLSRHKSRVYASLGWLKESHAIDDADLARFETIKKLRNEITHELAQKVRHGLPSNVSERFAEIVSLVEKIDRWWIVNVEIPTNPQFAGNEIDESAVGPSSRVLVLKAMVDIAHGGKTYLAALGMTRRSN